MKALWLAIGMFSVLPVPAVHDIDRGLAARAILAFPLVGLLLGGIAGAALVLTVALGATGLLAATVAIGLMAALTGALHLDGLADTADGLGSRKPAAQARVIMRTSDVGPMGVVSLVLVLLLQIAALAGIGEHGPMVAAACVMVAATVGREAVVLATVSTRYPRGDGFGALFTGVTRPAAALTSAVVVLGLAGLGGWVSGNPRGIASLVGAAIAAGLLAWLWARYLGRRLHGLTGDTFGSMVEVTTTSFLVVVALVL